MKKLLCILILLAGVFPVSFSIIFSQSVEAKNTYKPKSSHTYNIGPKGGCYYVNSKGRKIYVDRSLCS